MKQLFLTLIAALIALPTFPQLSTGGFTLTDNNLYYGIRVGMATTNFSGDDIDLDAKTALNIGATIGLRLSDTAPVLLESGLYYSSRGAKKDKVTVAYNNIDIPLLIKYGIQATDNLAVLPLFGPVFSYAISGKTKQPKANQTSQTIEYERVGTFDEKKAFTGGLRRPNMGIRLGCAAEYSNLYAELAYQFGITNVCKEDDYTAHSNALIINVGVNF